MLLGNTNNNGVQLESGSGGLNGGDGSGGEGGVQLKKGPWTAAEDAILTEYVRKHGEGNWNAVQRNTGLARCGKSCRLRWANHLRSNLKKGAFSPEEERLIVELHAQLGNKWARMAAQLPGRTDNEIKNYWNTRVKRHHRQGLPLYPPDIQPQHQQSSHSHHSCHSQPSTPTTPTSSFSFPITSTTPNTPTGHHHYHHHHSHSLHHFPPPCYSLSPTPTLPPTPPPLSPGLQSPHQPAYPTLTLFDTNNNQNNHNNNNNATTNNVSSAFNMPRTPPLLQNPPRFKRFHSDTNINTFAANNNNNINNNNNNNNNSINSSNNFQGTTSFPFSPFFRSPSSPSLLTSPTSNCNTSAAFSNATSKLFSLPSFPTLPVSFSNPNLSTMFRSPDDKDCFFTSTGSVYNLKPEFPSSQFMSPNGNAAETSFENEKLSVSTGGSELLEDLLEQTQAGNYGESSRRVSEDKSEFSGFNQWSDSSSINLSSGLKPKEEIGGQINVHEDISKLLNVIPSMQVPEWYTDSGEPSNCQSSVVTDGNLGLEMQQLASIFRV